MRVDEFDFTKNGNCSLGETAYDVVMVGKDGSDSGEFAEDLYGDKDKGGNSMEQDIDQQAMNYRSNVSGQKREQKLPQGICKLPVLTNQICMRGARFPPMAVMEGAWVTQDLC